MSECKRHVLHLIMIFGDTVICAAIVCLLSGARTPSVSFRIWPWFLFSALVYAANAWFQRRRMSLQVTVPSDIALCLLAGAGSGLVLSDPDGTFGGNCILLFLLLAGCAAHAAILPSEKWEDANLPLYADGLLIMLILHLGLYYYEGGIYQTAAIRRTFAGLLVTGLGLVLFRVRDLSPRALAAPLLTAILLALSAGIGSLAGGASLRLTDLILALRDRAVEMIIFLSGLLLRFLLFLASLLPDAEPEGFVPPPESVMIPNAAEEEIVLPAYAYVIAFLVLAAVLAALFALLMRALRGLRWEWRLPGAETPGVRRRSRIREALRAFLSRAREALLFRVSYIKNRNTAAGLLTYAERKFRKKAPRRAAGESGPAYLRRIAALGNAPGRGGYLELADLLERRFYGREAPPDVTRAFCRDFRRMVRGDARA